jgi:hypothetical protein
VVSRLFRRLDLVEYAVQRSELTLARQLEALRDDLERMYRRPEAEAGFAYTPLPPPGPDEDLPEPGKLPPGSRVGFTLNALFTGRVADLKGLARAALERALRIREKFLPEGHPDIVAVRGHLESLGTG